MATEGEQYQQSYQPQPFSGQMERGLLQYQLDCEDVIQKIEHTVKEERPILCENGMIEWVAMSDRPPMINQFGMNSIMSKLRSRMTKVFALSDFDEVMIERLAISFADNTIDDLYQHWDLYALRSPSDASFIVSLLSENYYAMLRKSKNANYLKFLKTSQIVQEVSNLREELRGGQHNSFEENRTKIPFLSAIFSKRK